MNKVFVSTKHAQYRLYIMDITESTTNWVMHCTITSWYDTLMYFSHSQAPPSFLSLAVWNNWKKAEIFWINRLCLLYCSTDCTLNGQCVWQLSPASYICVVHVNCLVPWLLLLFWTLAVHPHTINLSTTLSILMSREKRYEVLSRFSVL